MKDSMKQFYEYFISDEELMGCIRTTAEWNEQSFIQMKQLVEAVMKDYGNEDYYPKMYVNYFMLFVPSVINIISRFRACSESERLQGYTNESYLSMIAERIEQLEELCRKFRESLTDNGEMPDLKTGNGKDSMKRFYEYTGPDGGLKDYFCAPAEWNKKSFIKMKQLAEAVMKDYEDEDYYPKKFVRYFFVRYPNAVHRLNQCKAFHGEGTLPGYESSLRMAEQLDELYKKYCDSLWLTSPFPMSK